MLEQILASDRRTSSVVNPSIKDIAVASSFYKDSNRMAPHSFEFKDLKDKVS